MEQKYKVLFNLLNPMFIKSGCKEVTMSYDDDYNSQDNGYWCQREEGSKEIRFLVPVDRELSEYLEETVDNTDAEWTEDGESEFYAFTLTIIPEFRSVEIHGEYTTYGTEPIEETVIGMEDDAEALKPIFDYLREQGSDILEVDVDAGGDSGWVHNKAWDVNRKEIIVNSDMETLCLQMLRNHPGWEINEGSHVRFTFDAGNEIVILEFAYNTEEPGHELINEDKF